MLFDGRMLHGTGVNRTDKQRFVATMSNVKAWTRTQENWVISVAPDVLEKASPKLLHRIEEEGEKYGLKLNKDKCETITVRGTADIKFKSGEQVKETDESKYLGCYLNKTVDVRRELNKRMSDVYATWKN